SQSAKAGGLRRSLKLLREKRRRCRQKVDPLYSVGERRREIGIRITVGAGARDVLTMIFCQAFIIGAGLVFGFAGSLAVSRLLQSAVAGHHGGRRRTYVVVSVLLVLTAMLACYPNTPCDQRRPKGVFEAVRPVYRPQVSLIRRGRSCVKSSSFTPTG